MADANALGIASLAITQGFSQFHVFLPKISDVRRASVSVDTDIAADVRIGELAAFVGTMGVGIIVSSLSGSPIPAYASLFVCAIMIGIYETTLRAERPLERTV